MTMAGFYPQGSGELQAQIPGSARPRPLKLTKRGPVRSIRGLSAVGNLPWEIAERQRRQALRRLRNLLPDIGKNREKSGQTTFHREKSGQTRMALT
jgi:RNA 3'-terminal phosphate cyclase (ATP)